MKLLMLQHQKIILGMLNPRRLSHFCFHFYLLLRSNRCFHFPFHFSFCCIYILYGIHFVFHFHFPLHCHKRFYFCFHFFFIALRLRYVMPCACRFNLNLFSFIIWHINFRFGFHFDFLVTSKSKRVGKIPFFVTSKSKWVAIIPYMEAHHPASSHSLRVGNDSDADVQPSFGRGLFAIFVNFFP